MDDIIDSSDSNFGQQALKYPKSKNNLQCIGNCYTSSTVITHPITLEYVTDKYYPFCPVKEWEYVDPKTGEITVRTTDVCHNPTHNKDLSGREFEMNILTPSIDFNDEQFLKIFYNIHSFEEAINWIENKKYSPILTRLRIINSAWNAYAQDINIIDHRLVDFYIEVAKKKWVGEIYKYVHKYIVIEDGKIMFGNPNNNDLNAQDELVIRMNFLIERFINNDTIYKFLVKYLKHRRDDWEKIINHSNKIKEDYIDYIDNKIKMTIGML